MSDFGGAGSRLTRRQAMARGAGGLVAVSSLGALLAACGGDSGGGGAAVSATATGTGPVKAADVKGKLVLYSYPDWYGPDEFKDFTAKYPGASVKNVPSGGGAAQQIAQLSKGKGNYDLTLAGANVAEQFRVAGLLQPFDTSAVPNLKNVGSTFVKAFPYGIPTDFGRTGFGYRKDLIKERPTSWKELFALMDKYPSKTTMIKYDSDIQGMALRSLGFSINTKNGDELDKMQQVLLKLKPNLKAIIDTDFSKALIAGDAYFAINYDYDIAAAQQSSKNIVWVQPEEGVAAYLEGWVALKGTKHIDAVWALMDFHLEPKNYAAFVNATGTAYTSPAAEPFIKKAISSSKILKYAPESLNGIEFEEFLGPDQTAKRGKLWEEFLAA